MKDDTASYIREVIFSLLKRNFPPTSYESFFKAVRFRWETEKPHGVKLGRFRVRKVVDSLVAEGILEKVSDRTFTTMKETPSIIEQGVIAENARTEMKKWTQRHMLPCEMWTIHHANGEFELKINLKNQDQINEWLDFFKGRVR